MPFKTEAYRVMIASPSDLAEERQAASDAINEWNAQHAAAEGVVLLPVKWETHALPTSGIRPQEAINRQLVDMCDLLVGMFATSPGVPRSLSRPSSYMSFGTALRAVRTAARTPSGCAYSCLEESW